MNTNKIVDNKVEEREELKKVLFVDEKEIEETNLNEMIKESSNYGNITNQGKPIIKEPNKFIKKDILKLQFILRFFASTLSKNIQKEASLGEIYNWNEYLIPRDQILARMKDIVDEGFISKTNKGYLVKPFLIKSFLEYMKKRYAKQHGN